MVPTLFFYQLVLVVLLCRLLAGDRTSKSAYPHATAPECLNQLPLRTVDTSMHFCPHTVCAYRGGIGLGSLHANGHPNGGPWCQFQGTACGGMGSKRMGRSFTAEPGWRDKFWLVQATSATPDWSI